MWHLLWHSTWHLLWHSIWHLLWHFIWHFSDILSGILMGIGLRSARFGARPRDLVVRSRNATFHRCTQHMQHFERHVQY
jgi:hypothetical protein